MITDQHLMQQKLSKIETNLRLQVKSLQNHYNNIYLVFFFRLQLIVSLLILRTVSEWNLIKTISSAQAGKSSSMLLASVPVAFLSSHLNKTTEINTRLSCQASISSVNNKSHFRAVFKSETVFHYGHLKVF